MHSMLVSASEIVRPYIFNIAMAITAALLALFGNHINELVKSAVKGYNFFFRIAVFILLVAFGYGALAVLIAHGLAKILVQIPNLYLFLFLLLAFIVIGVIAEERRHI